LLVAPVFKPAATTRDVSLPQGDWYDWWNNEKVTGGKTISRKIDLETMPIYVRAGAIIPFDPIRQYTSEPVSEPTMIRVYAGADGQFRWYEDDGETQEYLQGQFAWTNLRWDDANQRLTIERDPSAGTLKSTAQKLVVQLLPKGASKEVNYNGRHAEVSF
jgi:alpha-glucosidase/alpha-D-xyloside xylohydrolase